jgi:hypothetical protein
MEKFLAKIPMWFPHDKCLHFISGAFGFTTYLYTAKLLGLHGLKFQILSLCVVAFLALLKEFAYDAHRLDKHSVDIWDAVATTAGAGLAFINSLYR